ncbi:hypothetical protein PsYK624_110540 [Phanerochaete sordida]|uniref:Reverse transcriptase n=1 Tax=Phanerochaete sordida TaxID=48140 RepID=A0A9P3GF32_9APHY|nr:hypothetical protein PsYK624_110540 [Phanerochaete sordida]
MEKIQRYTRAHWWKPATVPQAAPMLCIPKKDGGLRTVVDCRRRNDNTVKDVTPFPDQEQIRMDVARAPFRSKIDLLDAYEQIRVEPDDVGKTAFATVYGTMLSNVMQQGDCNGPATFQRLMTHVFRDYIGIFVHVYLDDIFIYSDSEEDHERHLRTVFETLRESHLFLKAKKCDLYSTRMDCLGHIIDDEGLHADADKMARVHEWCTLRNYHDVQRFLGLVQYLAHFMPNVSAYTGPLSAITRNGHDFEWRPLHQQCFDMIKHLACKAPILKPIDPACPDPIWVICDASTSGVGAFYGQGPEWTTCRPAGFMSRKFTDAQHAYRVFELETLAILEALMKWEDKLLGRKITIVTDHKALEFFKTQSRLSNQQTRWMEFMARFDYDIVYVKGVSNKVADSFSRYFSSDLLDEVHHFEDYVNVDTRLDPSGEDLPLHRIEELRAMQVGPSERQTARPRTCLFTRQQLEARHAEAQQMADATAAAEPVVGPELDYPSVAATGSPTIAPSSDSSNPDGDEAPLPAALGTHSELLDVAKAGYATDATFAKVLKAPKEYRTFVVEDGLIYSSNRLGQRVLCLPRTKLGKQSLSGAVIAAAHAIVGHFGTRKTSEYLRRWYWWPTLGRDVEKFCNSCGTCQTVKPSTQMPAGLLHSLPVPTRPWGSIAMDFLGPFPESGGFNYLWVVLCRLTSLVHLLPVRTTVSAVELAWLFVRDIVRLHGLPNSIVSDRDSKFTSKFWREVHRLLGTRLLMSTVFHPQTDSATERANRSISQVLRAMVTPDQTDWATHLPLAEFALNSSISSSTGFAPFELTYGDLPRMAQPEIMAKVAPGVQRFVEQARDNLLRAHDAIIDSRVHQTYHVNTARHDENVHRSEMRPIQVGDLVYLSTENLALPKGRARKLAPKFIGPYPVVTAHPSTSTYTLELPRDLRRSNIHPTFHVRLLRRHEPDDDVIFPHRNTRTMYDLGDDPDAEWLVDEIMSHRWAGRRPEFLIKWNLGDTTWEPLSVCKDLEALDRYLELFGARDWHTLPRRTSRASRA